IWMWKGSYFYTNSANGDRMIGWHVNAPDGDGTQVFYRFEQCKDRYIKYAVMQKLVTSRSVAETLKLLGDDDPKPGTFGRYEPAPVRLDVDRSVVDPALGVGATITVRPRGTNPDRLPARVELWVNDHPMMVWPQPNGAPLDPTRPFEVSVPIPARAFRSGENRLSVLSFAAGGGRAEDSQSVLNEKSAPTLNLHGLTVGIDDYTRSQVAAVAVGNRKGFKDLSSATKDALGLADPLRLFPGEGGGLAGRPDDPRAHRGGPPRAIARRPGRTEGPGEARRHAGGLLRRARRPAGGEAGRPRAGRRPRGRHRPRPVRLLLPGLLGPECGEDLGLGRRPVQRPGRGELPQGGASGRLPRRRCR